MQQEREKGKKIRPLNIYRCRQSDRTVRSLFVSSHEAFVLDCWCKRQKKKKGETKRRWNSLTSAWQLFAKLTKSGIIIVKKKNKTAFIHFVWKESKGPLQCFLAAQNHFMRHYLHSLSAGKEMFAFVTAASRWKEATSLIPVDMMCVFVSLWLCAPLYIIIYSLCKAKGYRFDEKTSSRRSERSVLGPESTCSFAVPRVVTPVVRLCFFFLFKSEQLRDFYFLDTVSPLHPITTTTSQFLGPATLRRHFP